MTRRLEEHNKGKTVSIKYLKPFKLVYKQEFETLEIARKIEYKLKSLKSRVIIEKIINEQNISLRP